MLQYYDILLLVMPGKRCVCLCLYDQVVHVVSHYTYLASIDNGFELQGREQAAVYDGLGNGEISVGDVRWWDAGKGVGLHYTIRM